jgi:hypothetical protein
MSRLLAPVAMLLAALVAAGCGTGAGSPAPDQVRLTVTDRFGERRLIERVAPEVHGDDTVMRLLQRNAEVETRHGGGFVQAIEGLAGGEEDGRPVDWFYFVNGLLAGEGAAAVAVRAGDRIWWDRHDWGHTGRVPAVVGSFPEPFVSGIGGDRLPTRVECDEAVRGACSSVQRRLADLGLPVGLSRPGTEGGMEQLRVLVGRWPAIRGDRALEQIEEGPRASGVFARVARDGATISALDATGRQVRRLGSGSGLIAATRWREDPPTWVVTGTDAAGVEAAARAFDESVLNEKFALAIDDEGLPVGLPVVGR